MNIQQLSRRGGFSLIGLIIVAIVFSAYGINAIRFGGEMHRVNQQLNDFNADILPPPEYLVESYLIANLVARSPEQVEAYAKDLYVLKRQWRERADHWAKSDLEPELKAGIAETVDEDGKAFWQTIESRLIPAAQRRDAEEIKRALATLDGVYARHRSHIDILVKGAARQQKVLADEAASTLMAIFVGLGLAVLLVLVYPSGEDRGVIRGL